ncbi:DUF2868 domain-containing protein [Moraxella catarrhalis]|uniref:DUF2868 domain-containing protein n=1 Tax=Moraxella catarrhalis TaxID=480 RepID=UPI0002029B99|nr:DUF2868 domain-containing protein [Moraxella catarrhalis]AXT96610.1 hypothetical protein SQ01_04860 [Moraxella catarrhalis]EGE27038.1 hypothetical protein EA1_04310 [Moraxella catarrhalis O35E]EKF83500.1 hypothetical protein MCRH_0957 [Moraxella catarrhalis RH4]MCG6832844.1 DUF2868 domain-containing protein [Moraxella catarrhalis]MCG6834552.1 DUF2868 domain-containing protein [Moraxella catarrhalis]
MTTKTKKAHQHLEVIRRLEAQNYIFTQDPKIITEAVKLENGTAFDKLFIRAQKIDSDARIMQILSDTQHGILSVIRLIYLLYFIFALIGVASLLGTQAINFFYLMVALLGWHTLSLVWWLISLAFLHRPSMLSSVVEHIALKNKLIEKLSACDKNIQKVCFSVLNDTIKPIKRWQIASILHGAWLFGLMGSILGMLGLFLFKSYSFHWESTLLTDHHFDRLITIIGYIPSQLGIVLPSASSQTPAQFAILAMTSVIIYAILPRLAAYLYSRIKARQQFRIDTKAPYYANLMNFYRQTIINADDYQSPKPTTIAPIVLSDRLVIAALEKPYYHHPIPINAIKDFGVIDTHAQIKMLLADALHLSAQIYLIINTDTVPDRGIVRKVERLASHQFGIIAMLVGEQIHDDAWKVALNERRIPIFNH